MPRFGFCGPTYQSQSLSLDAERAINLFPETAESQGAKSPLALYGSPGKTLFANIGATAILGVFACRPSGAITDRVFAVVQSGLNQTLYELFNGSAPSFRGTITSPTSVPVTFAENGTQLMLCTGGQVWVLPLSTNTLTGPISVNSETISMVDYCDGFGLALVANSNKFYVSNLLDFTTWSALNVAQVSEFPDNVISMKVNQRGIWFQGTKATVPYYNQGAAFVPFIPVQGVYIENGCGAQASVARADNSLFWLDLDERGQGIARRADGYTPKRISNHAVETIWTSYSTISDAIGYSYQEAGHTFYVLYFPSAFGADGFAGAGATWAFDVATGMWHERASWNANGHYEADHSRNHCFAWGKHLVGDWSSGNVYQQSIFTYQDNGKSIVRERVSPHVSKENEWLYFDQLTLDLEPGLTSTPPLTGFYSGAGIQNALTIPDQTNAAWSLTIDDGGIIIVNPGSRAIQTVIINDSTSPNTSYQLTFNNGTLTPILVQFNSAYPLFIPMASSGSQLQTGLYISGGQVQVSQPLPALRGPQLLLYISKDGAHTWGQPRTIDLGLPGKFKKRAYATRLGRSRIWTFKIVYSDPVPIRLIDAYLRGAEWPPQERLTKQLQKMA